RFGAPGALGGAGTGRTDGAEGWAIQPPRSLVVRITAESRRRFPANLRRWKGVGTYEALRVRSRSPGGGPGARHGHPVVRGKYERLGWQHARLLRRAGVHAQLQAVEAGPSQ